METECIASLEDLTLQQTKALLAKAVKFQISSEVAVEIRPHHGQMDRWAITLSGRCYDFNRNRWEYEPLPSSRSDAFIQRTRYPLREALRIVEGESFAKYLHS